MAFLGNDGGEGDPFELVNRMNEIGQKINNVAEERNRVFAESQGKEWNIAIMGGAIAWAIYHFLIRR